MTREIDSRLESIALQLLDKLERKEMELLLWGSVDGAFTEEEVQDEAGRLLTGLADAAASTCPSGEFADLDQDEVVDWLQDHGWLWRGPTGGFRTRFAESVRLMSRLRQIRDWNGRISDDAWRTAPSLVADYRLEVRPRAFPRRECELDDGVTGAQPGGWELHSGSKLRRETLRCLVADAAGNVRRLAGFQVRATSRILAAVDAAARQKTGPTGTVICAGTGSGKTLAFYLPALAEIAFRVDQTYWVKALAVYPRNELLKDQLREALISGRKARGPLETSGKRPIVFGSLTGLVPNDANAVERGYSPWARTTVEGRTRRAGRVCPFVRCLDCNGDLAWLDTDRNAGVERLHCISPSCGGRIEPDELRLTRSAMKGSPPDVLFISTEMMNQRMSSNEFAPLLGLGQPREKRPILLLLDEIHDYEGMRGAHTAMLLRRWRHEVRAPVHFVGLSATLEDAERFFADLVGLKPASIRLVEPDPSEMEMMGAEYLVALRGDPSSGAGLLSTTIQTVMLARRILGLSESDESAGSRVFAFADDLDVINRLFFNLLDAEGRDQRSRPTNRRPLAYHRGSARPMERERLQEGQNWDLCERIGHDLGAPLHISRTSSQDQGVDTTADVVVATTSLEVGFDDPSVGAVVQHKAPPGPARFLQRKGRAGRTRSMRPWTIIVLSDFGRDRVQYLAYEQLFSPILAPRYLPLSNRTMLRMQATYALFSWLGRASHGKHLWPWKDLAAPLGHEAWAKERRATYLKRLSALLDDQTEQENFRAYLAAALGLAEPEVDALLWEPPRSVLLEAVPTILRRLERDWHRAFREGDEPSRKKGPPIPEFVQAQLFGELLTPEIEVRNSDTEDLEVLDEMKIVQAISEFSPGRVSRRFGIRSDWGHWVDPGSGTTLDVNGFCPVDAREHVRVGRFIEDGAVGEVRIIRPYCFHVRSPPANVDPSSNAHPIWRVQVVQGGGKPHLVDPPSETAWADLLQPIAFHTHHLGAPVELRRFSVGSRVNLIRDGQRQPEVTLRFSEQSEDGSVEPAALGFAADVDGVLLRYRTPAGLDDACAANESLARSLPPQFFRDMVRADSRLDAALNRFQRDQLVEGFLVAVCDAASVEDISISEAVGRVARAPERVAKVLELLALWAEGEAEHESQPEEDPEPAEVGRGTPRRVRELCATLRLPDIWEAVVDLARHLTSPNGVQWQAWLQERFRATLGAAARDAVLAMCPRTDPDSILLELRDGEAPPDGEGALWLLETVLGGAGALEAFYEAYSRDPRRFFRLLEAGLGLSDREAVASRMELTLEALVHPDRDRLRDSFSAVRQAETHADSRAANAGLRLALADTSIVPDPSFLVSLHARLLRPGSGPESDAYLARLVQRWNDLERRLSCEISTVGMAVIARNDTDLEEALGLSPPDGPEAQEVWRYSILRGLLWSRGGALREESLQVGNRFDDAASCDRLIVSTIVGDYIPTVSLMTEGWFEHATSALASTGVCDLVVAANGRKELASALMKVATTRLETEGLRLHARLAGVSRTALGWSARLELPEAYQ